MEVELYGDCVRLTLFKVQKDRGSFTIPAQSLLRRGRSSPDSCEVDLAIRRLRAGRTDPTLNELSSLVAGQERRLRFFSVP